MFMTAAALADAAASADAELAARLDAALARADEAEADFATWAAGADEAIGAARADARART